MKYFGIPFIIFFILVGMTTPKIQKVQAQAKQEVQAEELSTTQQENKLGDMCIRECEEELRVHK